MGDREIRKEIKMGGQDVRDSEEEDIDADNASNTMRSRSSPRTRSDLEDLESEIDADLIARIESIKQGLR